ncbi:MAG TPA: DNA alkylation repair protein [Thermoanaerobaculia bacterium]|nr:DNA alkylation repair protein [Thermoanaerobaculia bacterium]
MIAREQRLFRRIDAIAGCLREELPPSIPRALAVVVDSLGSPRTEPGYGPWEKVRILCLARFVSKFGLEDYEPSMRTLREITRRFTAEFDVRYFIVRHEQALATLTEWAVDDDFHVRRLVSESLRPRLPWSFRLAKFVDDPDPVLKILDMLKDDPEKYVRKSIANCLGDIAKDHRGKALSILDSWSVTASDERRWIVDRARRRILGARKNHFSFNELGAALGFRR